MSFIYGPFSKSVVYDRWSDTKIWYRQKVPYTARLIFDQVHILSEPIPNSIYGFGGGDVGRYSSTGLTYDAKSGSPVMNEALAKVYPKFRDLARSQLQFAATLAERRDTVDMLAKRSLQILKFASAVKSLNFVKAGKALGFTMKRKRTKGSKEWWIAKANARNSLDRELVLKRDLKKYGENYLEFHFGWEPLVKDIYAGAEMLTEPRWPIRTIRARSGASQPAAALPAYANYRIDTTYAWVTKVQLIADVHVTQPDLLTLNQMGVINPASVLWEVIPFSFVVDWFSNVSDVLNSVTDFAGLSLVNPATTVYNVITEISYYNYRTDGINYQTAYTKRTVRGIKRTQGITSPPLVLRRFKLPSITRAATAISLLTLALKG